MSTACFGNVPLTSKYDHTIIFSSRDEQTTYFARKLTSSVFTDLTFVRRGTPLQLKRDGVASEALAWNYAKISNGGDPSPRYYFVTAVRYINENTVEVDLELDVVQTYLFDVELLPCLIERQHTVTDEIGEHTVDEGLETGELVNLWQSDLEELTELDVLMLCSLWITISGSGESYTFGDTLNGSHYDGIFSGLKAYSCEGTPAMLEYFGSMLNQMGNKIEGVTAIWTYPRALIENRTDLENAPSCAQHVKGSKSFSTKVAKRHEIDGYTPLNNKLLTFPYTFLSVTNNEGEQAVYRYERFASDLCEFEIKGAISPDAGARIEPKFYNGTGDNYEAGLTLGAFPTCSWDADTYKIWLANNQSQLKVDKTTNAVKIGAGLGILAATVLSGGGAAALAMGQLPTLAAGSGAALAAGGGLLASGVSGAASQIAQQKDMDTQPPQARGSYSTSINAAHGKQTFSFYAKSINAEHARRIDDFFTMYGYKLNVIGVPNRTARPSFTYVKTSGCKVAGAIQHTDAERLEAIYDNGITFWVPTAKLGDYTQSNAPR